MMLAHRVPKHAEPRRRHACEHVVRRARTGPPIERGIRSVDGRRGVVTRGDEARLGRRDARQPDPASPGRARCDPRGRHGPHCAAGRRASWGGDGGSLSTAHDHSHLRRWEAHDDREWRYGVAPGDAPSCASRPRSRTRSTRSRERGRELYRLPGSAFTSGGASRPPGCTVMHGRRATAQRDVLPPPVCPMQSVSRAIPTAHGGLCRSRS